MESDYDKTYSVFEQNNQLKVTVPLVLAVAIGIKKGDKVRWIIDRGELVLRKALEKGHS